MSHVSPEEDDGLIEDLRSDRRHEDGVDAAQLDVTEAPDLMRQESFLTEVEEFHGTEETKEVSAELETELRPVFELCQPNSDGLISISHLRAMCREHGQVRYYS